MTSPVQPPYLPSFHNRASTLPTEEERASSEENIPHTIGETVLEPLVEEKSHVPKPSNSSIGTLDPNDERVGFNNPGGSPNDSPETTLPDSETMNSSGASEPVPPETNQTIIKVDLDNKSSGGNPDSQAESLNQSSNPEAYKTGPIPQVTRMDSKADTIDNPRPPAKEKGCCSCCP